MIAPTFQVSGVSYAPAYLHILDLPGTHVSDVLGVASAAQVLVSREQADPAR